MRGRLSRNSSLSRRTWFQATNTDGVRGHLKLLLGWREEANRLMLEVRKDTCRVRSTTSCATTFGRHALERSPFQMGFAAYAHHLRRAVYDILFVARWGIVRWAAREVSQLHVCVALSATTATSALTRTTLFQFTKSQLAGPGATARRVSRGTKNVRETSLPARNSHLEKFNGTVNFKAWSVTAGGRDHFASTDRMLASCDPNQRGTRRKGQ